MINIVFEGPTGAGKTTIINKLYEKYGKEYKVSKTCDIDASSPLYDIIKNMFDENPLISMNSGINTLGYETLIQAADYLYLREKMYSNNSDINFFDRNYASVYSYQSVLLENDKSFNKEFMENVLKCMKSGEKQIDLMVFFDVDMEVALKRSEERDKRKYSKEEKKTFIRFNEKLKDFIRYNNSEYKLLVIKTTDTIEESINKISEKIDEIIIDKKKIEEKKWYELYKIDVDEFEKPDDYIKYKLSYKKKMINEIIRYSYKGKVIEMGCGTGLVAGYLQKKGLDVTALDKSSAVLKYAEELAKQSNIISPCKYEVGDILDLKYKKNSFNVVFSNGVMEHFNDEEIIRILSQQLDISKIVIFGVPSTYFNMNEKMLGNERSLTSKEWKNLIKKSGGLLIKKKGFNYYNFFRRLTEPKKWLKPKAFWLFVIKKDIKGDNYE